MAYTDFTLKELDKKFGIDSQVSRLFDISRIDAVSPSDWLTESLEIGSRLRLNLSLIHI